MFDLRLAITVTLSTTCAAARHPIPIDPALAIQYFHEARNLSDVDAGRLWGKTLYGPMLFVDPVSRTVVANQSDGESKLTRNGDVYSGTLPPGIPIANTAVDWAGVRWTMVIWPPGGDVTERGRLLIHECFHRIQPEIGLVLSDPLNAHLDTLEGRYWLQLEWRALRAALS